MRPFKGSQKKFVYVCDEVQKIESMPCHPKKNLPLNAPNLGSIDCKSVWSHVPVVMGVKEYFGDDTFQAKKRCDDRDQLFCLL